MGGGSGGLGETDNTTKRGERGTNTLLSHSAGVLCNSHLTRVMQRVTSAVRKMYRVVSGA